MQVLSKNKKKYIKQLFFRCKDDDISGLSAQITYYLILSFFPFLIFLLNTLSFTPISTSDITQNIVKFLPQETSNLILSIVSETVGARSITLLSAGMLATIWSSSKEDISISLNSSHLSNSSKDITASIVSES